MDEGQAIARLKQGDLAGLEFLVVRYQVVAVQTAYLIVGDRPAAEDIAQAAFLKAAERIHQFKDGRPFRPWFFRVLRNVCLDANRRRKRRQRQLERLAGTISVETSRSRGDDLLELLRLLPPADRELLVLRFVQGLSLQQIAEHFSCSVEAAKKRSQRAVGRPSASQCLAI